VESPRTFLLIGIAIVAAVVVPVAAWQLLHDSATSAARLDRKGPSTERAPRDSAPTVSSSGCNAITAISKLPLEQRLAQLLMVGAGPINAQTILTRYAIGGILILGPTVGELSPDSGTRLNSYSRIPPFVAIDEEGGRVQRIPDLVGAIPSARVMAQTMTPAQVAALAAQRGQALRRYGITMDLAPDADVSDQPNSGVIGDRSFSNNPAAVALYAGAFADGLRQAGVIPIIKHFPGHGHAVGDPQNETAVTPSIASLEASDLVPYRSLLSSKPLGVMVGELDVPGLTTSQQPASLNPNAINGLLRTQFGFKGFVMTDELETMVAVTQDHTLPGATLEALQAGATMALSKYDDQVPAVLNTLTQAVRSGSLSESLVDQDVEQVLTLKQVDPCTTSLAP
jgi:beta-N-acetylhexosaminidase